MSGLSTTPASARRRHPVWLLLATGAAFACWLATSYGLGSAARIGSGVFPMVLSLVILLLSLWSYAVPREETADPFALRPFAAVVLAVVLFILLIERIGIVPTIVVTMVTAFAGQAQRDFAPFMIYAVAFAFAAGLLFSVGLSMPVPLFGAN